MTDITEKRNLEKKLADQQIKQQRLITETTIQSQEQEKNQLGRELHDNINQILATVKMYLGISKSGQGVDNDLVGKSYEYLNEAIAEIRKLSHSLVAPSLGGIGLQDALEDLIERFSVGNDLEVKLMYEVGDGYYGDSKIELMFYRIIQEQINNIIKYAHAKNAVISFRKDEDKIYLTISDNGVGFDTTKTRKGIGLINIANRVSLYSGTLKVISSPGEGCTLEIEMPFNSQTEPS
jgi:two-component system sensor histidine kinase UhpB